MTVQHDERLVRWLAALETRYLADLRVQEVTRALRALSTRYVERRHHRPAGCSAADSAVRGSLDTAGKRAAFALFYAPLHLIATSLALRALRATTPQPRRILDLGCGTGAAGAAWALECGGGPAVLGLERHPWAVAESRWTYRQLGLTGDARQADITRPIRTRSGEAVVAGWVLNELSQEGRSHVERHLLAAARGGMPVLVLEPIARSVVPWWDATAALFVAAGGRADEWRFSVDLPPLLQMFDQAAGLDHRELTVRTLFV